MFDPIQVNTFPTVEKGRRIDEWAFSWPSWRYLVSARKSRDCEAAGLHSKLFLPQGSSLMVPMSATDPLGSMVVVVIGARGFPFSTSWLTIWQLFNWKEGWNGAAFLSESHRNELLYTQWEILLIFSPNFFQSHWFDGTGRSRDDGRSLAGLDRVWEASARPNLESLRDDIRPLWQFLFPHYFSTLPIKRKSPLSNCVQWPLPKATKA